MCFMTSAMSDLIEATTKSYMNRSALYYLLIFVIELPLDYN